MPENPTKRVDVLRPAPDYDSLRAAIDRAREVAAAPPMPGADVADHMRLLETAHRTMLAAIADIAEALLPAPGDLPAARHVVKIEPGDRLLVTFSESIDPREADHAVKWMTDWFPGAEFAVVPMVTEVVQDRRAAVVARDVVEIPIR